MTVYITRFAPSPTGNLHIGSARTALINYVFKSQHPNSKLYLRIEDTDKERSTEEYKKNIISSLKWLGIEWENNLQIQSLNINRHLEVAKSLLENKKAYKCICSQDELAERRKKINSGEINTKKICITCENNNKVQSLEIGYVIRIKIPTTGKEILKDLIQGQVEVNNYEIDDFVLVRKDNTPTYMLSVVVDDHDLGVNFIIRGDDHLNNYFRQKFIYQYMKWEIPEYAHIPLIHGEDGSKLSKRHGAVNLIDLKNEGYLPSAIINNLILLGWSPKKQNDEIIELANIISKFEIKTLSKSASIFSYKKLDYFNNHYLRLKTNIKIFEEYCRSNSALEKLLNIDKEKLFKVFNVYKKDISKYIELLDIVEIYFSNNFLKKIDKNFEQDFNYIYEDFLKLIKNINNWEYENINLEIKEFIKKNNIKFPVLGKPVRYLLTNDYNGPSITDIFMILGKTKTLERLKRYNI
ncbi:glutamate--tRNA ligase [Pelagibacterales bacterium SAG-MED31]|nr:glutamate--tRNA ligase [Pelagibacterales bacterium SAG-MED31]